MMNSKLSKQLGLENESLGVAWWASVIGFLVFAGWLVLIFAGDPTGRAFFGWLVQ